MWFSAASLAGLVLVLLALGVALAAPGVGRSLRRRVRHVLGSRWRATVIGIAVVTAGLGLTAVAVILLTYRQVVDTDRCADHSRVGLRPVSLQFGGWGDPDTCSYEDAHGEPAYPDGTSVRRSPASGPVPEVAASGTAASVVAAILLAVRSRRRP